MWLEESHSGLLVSWGLRSVATCDHTGRTRWALGAYLFIQGKGNVFDEIQHMCRPEGFGDDCLILFYSGVYRFQSLGHGTNVRCILSTLQVCKRFICLLLRATAWQSWMSSGAAHNVNT